MGSEATPAANLATPPTSAPTSTAPAVMLAPAKTVPQERYNATVAEKRALADKLEALQAEVQTLTERASTADTLAAQVKEWQEKAATAEARFGTFTEFSAALGVTDADVVGQFDAKYRALPEKDRPARAAWVEALKAKPDDAPAVLRPWLATVQANGAPTAPSQPRPPGSPPTPPSAPANVSAEEIKRVREKAVASGDWTEWKELRVRMGLASAPKR